MNLVSPIFFNSNRVCSTNKGGELLDGFLGGTPKDGQRFSTEWLEPGQCSKVIVPSYIYGLRKLKGPVFNQPAFIFILMLLNIDFSPLPEFLPLGLYQK